MFDLHLKHDIVPLKEGTSYLRDAIKETMNKNLLKPEHCDHHLIEIREYGLRLEKCRVDTIKKIEDNFNLILQTLRKRQSEFLSDVIDKYKEEKEQIETDENKWKELQSTGLKVLEMSKNPNDAELLLNAKFIMDTIRALNEDVRVKNSKIYSAVNTELPLDSNTSLSYEQILHYLKSYFTIDEPNILEFTS